MATPTEIKKIPAFLVIPFLIFYSCNNTSSPYLELAGSAQGTTFSIKYNDIQKRDFSSSIDSLFRVVDKSMSLWDSTSLITRVNQSDSIFIADEHFEKVFSLSHEIFDSTDGIFDPTVGPLVQAWGFSFKKGLPPPDSMQVDSLKQLIGFEKIKLENGLLTKADPQVALDFNAIAQGYTVDLVSEFLESKEIKNYLVELGGEVHASGVNERDSPWVIGIDKPVEFKEGERPLQTTVILDNRSLATSGSYRKFIEREGKKFSHVIDPATGYPVGHNMLSISVITEDCAKADAYATAFLVMGMERAFEAANELEMEIYCIYSHDNGTLSVRSTPGFGK